MTVQELYNITKDMVEHNKGEYEVVISMEKMFTPDLSVDVSDKYKSVSIDGK